MEQPNMFPVTINEELFRILFPSVKEAANASGTNAIMGLLTDSCYALLLYKPVPGSAARPNRPAGGCVPHLSSGDAPDPLLPFSRT